MAVIELIPTLSDDLKTAAQAAYTDALRIVWISLTAISAAGLLMSGLMKYFPLHTQVNAAQGREGEPVDTKDAQGATV